MARTEQEIASDINAKNEVKILEALKDYFAKKYNTNFENIKLNLDAIKNALSGLSGVTQHLGVPHEPSATAPTNPNEYDWYFDTSTNKFMMYHNSAWVTIADLANLVNLDAKYLRKTDAANTYATLNQLTQVQNDKASKTEVYDKTEIDTRLSGKQAKLTTNQQAVVDGVPLTQAEKNKIQNAITSSSDLTDITGDITKNKAAIAKNEFSLLNKQDVLSDNQKLVINANPYTDEEKAKVATAVQPAAISNVLRTGDVYTNAEIDSKVATASGQFAKGTIAELNDAVNGAGVTSSNKKVLVIDDLKKMVENQNLINKGSFVNFVDKVIYKDNTTLEYFDTVLNIEVKDAAATTTGTIMTLSNPLDVYGRISVEGTSFGAVFEVPCAVEYNFASKNKGVKFYGTKGQDYKWELISKYENDIRVNYVKFEGTSTMSVTDNPGASATWTTVTTPYEVKMDTLFDKDNRNANINIDYNPSLPANGTHILNLEYYTTIPYLESRIANIIAQIQKDIASATPNFTPEQQAVLAANAFTDAYKGKLDNAPDNINTKLGEKLDVSTYNTDKSTFLTSASISGKADTTYVDTELGKKQDKLSTTQLGLLASDAIKFTQVVDDRITANRTDIINIKGKGAFLGKFADATARDAALSGTTLVNGDYVILGDPAVRWVYDLRSTSWVEDISHSAAISSITLQDVASAQDPKIATAKQEAITSANTHTDGAITTLTNTVNGKQDSIDAGKLALLDGAVKFTQADKTKVDGAIQAHQDISGKANVSLDNISISGNVGKIPKVGTNGKFTYVDMPIIPDVSGFETSTDITRKINDKFTEQSDKLTSNNTDAIPGEAKIGHGYKGVQSYGEAASVQHYGKGAINTINIGEGTTSTINVGKNSTGALMIGSDAPTIISANQKLINASKSATFEKIIDTANGNVFTDAYKTKLDNALQSSDISNKVDVSTMNSELAKKQNILTDDEKLAISKLSFTDAEKSKVDSAVQPTALDAYYTKTQIDTSLSGKKNNFNDNRLLHSDSSSDNAIFRQNAKYHTQSYLDNAGAYVGAFNANNTKYATVKMDGETPVLFGNDGTHSYNIAFNNIQTKFNDDQMNVINATPFTQAEKTKLANTASSTDAAAKANKDLSNITTDQEKADFISNLQRIGVQVALFNEFKGVLASDPTGTHADLDWYINDTTYVIKVWHNNAWHDIGRPDHVLTKAEVMTALGLTQTDIDNLKHFTQHRSAIDLAINHSAKFSHLPDDTVGELAKKADKTTTYTKSQVDGAINTAKTAAIHDAVQQANTHSDTALNTGLASKANANDVYTKTQSDNRYATPNLIATKVEVDAFNTEKSTVRNLINAKSDTTYVNTELGKKQNKLSQTQINNINSDHSVYALKSEIPTEVDIKNSVDYIDGKLFQWKAFGSEYIVSNNLRIFNNFWMGSDESTLNKYTNEPRGIKVFVNNSLRGWHVLKRIVPGSQGTSMAFDLQGYYESDGGISKLKFSLGAASNQNGWSFVKSHVTFKAIATPSKKWADVVQSYLEWNLDFVAKKDLSNVSEKSILDKLPQNIKDPKMGEWVKVQFNSGTPLNHSGDILKLMALHDIDMYLQDITTEDSGGVEIPVSKDYEDITFESDIFINPDDLSTDVTVSKLTTNTGADLTITKAAIKGLTSSSPVTLINGDMGRYGMTFAVTGIRTTDLFTGKPDVRLRLELTNDGARGFPAWMQKNLAVSYSSNETIHITTGVRRNVTAYNLDTHGNIQIWAANSTNGYPVDITSVVLTDKNTLNIEFFRKPNEPRIRLQNGREV